ncbi:MAG: hypothetical protein U9N30_03345 [Campylobacterota bacterium]|nr:hypothetical protein [Campylobacterota bacterium]
MKLTQITKLTLASLLMTMSLQAAGKKPEFNIHELINLPHPLQAILKNEINIKKLGLTQAQVDALNTKMLAVYPPAIQGMMYKASALEEQIKIEVLKNNKTPNELKDKIDTLEQIKRDVTTKHIESLNVMATILSPKQYQQGLKLFAKMKAKKMYTKLKKQFERK